MELAYPLRKVQGRVSTGISDSTLSKLQSPFFNDSNKLAGTQALLIRPLNILPAVFAGSGAFPTIYINKEIQDIIWIVIKARLATAKDLYE